MPVIFHHVVILGLLQLAAAAYLWRTYGETDGDVILQGSGIAVALLAVVLLSSAGSLAHRFLLLLTGMALLALGIYVTWKYAADRNKTFSGWSSRLALEGPALIVMGLLGIGSEAMKLREVLRV